MRIINFRIKKHYINKTINIKNIGIVTLLIICLTGLNSCAPTVGFSLKTGFDREFAKDVIEELKEQPLLVVLPTERKKINLLKDVDPEKAAFYSEQREILNKALVDAFTEGFDFTDVWFIPDSLVHDYENGIKQPYFVNSNMQLDASIGYIFEAPIKLILADYTGKRTFEVTKRNEIVPNPFPCEFKIGQNVDNWSLLGRILYVQSTWRMSDLSGWASRISASFHRFSVRSVDANYQEIRSDLKSDRPLKYHSE